MLFLLTALASLAVAAKAPSAITTHERALAGAAYPPPTNWKNSARLKSAVKEFEKIIASSDAVQANDSAWTVAVFTTSDNDSSAPLYEKYFTPVFDVGVKKVNKDSVFRIASVSKVFSVWSFLVEVGDEHFNDPITKYVPELANLPNPMEDDEGVVYDDIGVIRWEEVTLGQLASHLAGIPRDPAAGDLSAQFTQEMAQALGFPKLDKKEIPQCGAPLQPSCSRKDMMKQLVKLHPVFSTAYSPAYTNIGYGLLGYAQEAITGQPVKDAINDNILRALNMKSSAFDLETLPKKAKGVIPGGKDNATAVGWDEDSGPSNPAGSIYSSTADMIKAGRAILGSKLMTPARTRRWLSPKAQTGILSTAVGAPWEIRYLPLLNQRITQLYTKQGDIGGYRSALVLSPEHNLGAVVFAAGSKTSGAAKVREDLMNAIGQAFLPAAEKQARDEAKCDFAGTYTDKSSNSSLRIEVEKGGPAGLKLTELISRGQDIIGPNSPFKQLYGAGQNARLFPSHLRTLRKTSSGKKEYASRLGFRATFFNATEEGLIQDPGLSQWTALDGLGYGGVALDDFVFEMGENGRARGVDVGILRLKLKRD